MTVATPGLLLRPDCLLHAGDAAQCLRDAFRVALGGQVQHKSGGGGIAAQCRGVLLRRYPAPVEQNDAVAVGVQSGGRASCRDDCASRADFPDEAVQSGALGGVQSFCGVIQQEEFRFSQQCLCQRDASADDIRQGAYAFILHVRDGGLPAHGGYLPDRVLSPQAFCPCDKVQVLPDGHIGGGFMPCGKYPICFFASRGCLTMSYPPICTVPPSGLMLLPSFPAGLFCLLRQIL